MIYSNKDLRSDAQVLAFFNNMLERKGSERGI
jgi:hypothetical protein